MGMFDYVHFNCPKCDFGVVFQTKDGPCALFDYDLQAITGSIAESLKYKDVFCPSCGSSIKFETYVEVHVKAVAE